MVVPRSQRPVDLTPVHTLDLPVTPPADRNIPAEAWIEAPAELLSLGDTVGDPNVVYLRQIGPFVVWRAGPGTTRSATAWLAVDVGDTAVTYRFEQRPDGTGSGTGPDGTPHDRFRTWKESLLVRSDR